MAQQTDAENGSTDPELTVADTEDAQESIQIHSSRDDMREMCRQWELSGYSGTKGEMAETMVEQAPEEVAGALAEEGVEIIGTFAEQVGMAEPAEEQDEEAEDGSEDEEEQEQDDSEEQADEPLLAAPEDVPGELLQELGEEHNMGAGAIKGSLAFNAPESEEDCESEADEVALEARRRAGAWDPEEHGDEGEDDSSQPPGSLAGDLLGRHPEEYGYTAKLQMTEKQTGAIVAALEDPEATQEEVAEAGGCTARYANSTLNRWRGTEDEVAAAEEAGATVPDEYVDVAEKDLE